MIEFDWQTTIALAIVSMAIGYLCLRFFGGRSNPDSGCGGCGGNSGSACGKNSEGIKRHELVQLGDPKSKRTEN